MFVKSSYKARKTATAIATKLLQIHLERYCNNIQKQHRTTINDNK